MKKLASVLVAIDAVEPGIMALNKAVSIAAAFDAEIDLLVADARHVAAMAAHCAALGFARITVCSLHHDGEPLHDLILRKTAVIRPDLVVKASQGALDQDDWRLASQCQAPLLLASEKIWGPLPRFAAAIEVGENGSWDIARSLLPKAAFLTRGCNGSLDLLCSERDPADETLRMEHAVQLARLLREFHMGSERLQMFSGPPEENLPPLIAARHYDLLVLGFSGQSPGQNPVNSAAKESQAGRLVAATHGDLMLISTDFHSHAGTLSASRSGRQQILHEREQFV